MTLQSDRQTWQTNRQTEGQTDRERERESGSQQSSLTILLYFLVSLLTLSTAWLTCITAILCLAAFPLRTETSIIFQFLFAFFQFLDSCLHSSLVEIIRLKINWWNPPVKWKVPLEICTGTLRSNLHMNGYYRCHKLDKLTGVKRHQIEMRSTIIKPLSSMGVRFDEISKTEKVGKDKKCCEDDWW